MPRTVTAGFWVTREDTAENLDSYTIKGAARDILRELALHVGYNPCFDREPVADHADTRYAFHAYTHPVTGIPMEHGCALAPETDPRLKRVIWGMLTNGKA